MELSCPADCSIKWDLYKSECFWGCIDLVLSMPSAETKSRDMPSIILLSSVLYALEPYITLFPLSDYFWIFSWYTLFNEKNTFTTTERPSMHITAIGIKVAKLISGLSASFRQ